MATSGYPMKGTTRKQRESSQIFSLDLLLTKVAALNFVSLSTTCNTVALLSFMRTIHTVLLETQSLLSLDTRNRLGFFASFWRLSQVSRTWSKVVSGSRKILLWSFFLIQDLKLQCEKMIKVPMNFGTAPVPCSELPLAIPHTGVLAFALVELANYLGECEEYRPQS